jgi:hypothetical protein
VVVGNFGVDILYSKTTFSISWTRSAGQLVLVVLTCCFASSIASTSAVADFLVRGFSERGDARTEPKHEKIKRDGGTCIFGVIERQHEGAWNGGKHLEWIGGMGSIR